MTAYDELSQFYTRHAGTYYPETDPQHTTDSLTRAILNLKFAKDSSQQAEAAQSLVKQHDAAIRASLSGVEEAVDLIVPIPGKRGELNQVDPLASVSHLKIHGASWSSAARWWGPGLDGKPLELDIVAQGSEPNQMLVGEVKLTASEKEVALVLQELSEKAVRCPITSGKKVRKVVWVLHPKGRWKNQRSSIGASAVLRALRY